MRLFNLSCVLTSSRPLPFLVQTYTMEGPDDGETRGVIPRSIDEIFGYIHNSASHTARFLVRVSSLQLYMEGISDLLRYCAEQYKL